jgi:membrane protein required for colicin V production
MNVIDIIALLPLTFFVVSGFKKGILKEVFGLFALILGIIISLQFSNYTVEQISSLRDSTSPYLPIFVYVLLFVAVFVVVIYVGNLLEKILKATQLNLGNRIAGAAIGALKAILIVSFFIWLADLADFFDENVKRESIAYLYIKQFTPVLIELIGELIPALKELIANIEEYFKNIVARIDSSH